ncbi:conserved exported hypothetical protein [Vibrio chagasii]|nr:conserved exported hypothetical protein [Vibrio chagasii]CAH7004352.1 conserved exported hypothetical protein [Vibrio chagasii]CAH7009492.1 conserved exported hypothetical protein [Vibrio chagasii]CAH7092525.1 conserved exported hypothetical protein [Vibrio chagasii]CAH7143594.1 conserved exported hypothetical protein [Vibrio chagasii]
MKRYRQYLSLSLALIAFNSNALQCGAGEVEVDGVCVSSCKILKGSGKNLTWDSYIWGDNPRSYCIGDRSTGAACNMAPSTVSVSVEAGRWTNKFYYTGSTCGFDQINRYSGDVPELFPFEGDVNQNGVQDDLEDWDGDGIKNGEDPNPYSNDNQVADSDGNNVPDNLDEFYERLEEAQTVNNCFVDDDNRDCLHYRYVMDDLNNNNSKLIGIVSDLSRRNLTKEDFNRAVAELINTQKTNDLSFSHKIDALTAAQGGLENTVRDSVFAARQDIKNRLEDRYKQTFHRFDDLDEEVAIVKRNTQSIIHSISDFPAGDGGALTGAQSNWLLDSVRNSVSNMTKNDQLIAGQKTERDLMVTLNRDLASKIQALEVSGGGLTDQQKSQIRNAAKANLNNKLLKAMSSDVARLSNIEEKVLSNNSMIDGLYYEFEDVNSKIDSLGTPDLSGIEASLSDLSTKLDGLETGDMSGVENKLTDLIDSVTNTNNFNEPNYGFSGEDFIITPTQISEAQNEVLEIKQEMADEYEKFKALFSIDTSSFNNGTYKEHSLNLNVNHTERSFKSGVFEALLDNASLIAAVIMFMFVVSGIKMLGKD